MKTISRPKRGMALVLTLAFVVMLTILMVGMAGSMRSDRAAAVSHAERTRAQLMTQAATDGVIAKLRQYTSDPARNWVTQPGQIYVGSEVNDPATPSDERKILRTIPVPLSSGVPTDGWYTGVDPVLETPNLNITTLRDPGSHLITDLQDSTGNPIRMGLKWIYVRKSGLIDDREPGGTNPLDTQDTSDPIVGRYAYWTDDESSKINYNIAWGRSAANTYDRCHASKIDLTAIPGADTAMANQIRSAIVNGGQGLPVTGLMPAANATYHFFNTPEDIRRLGESNPALRTAMNQSKFELTHYNHDPDTTFFGDDRILLTTNKNLVPHITNSNGDVIYLRKFIDVLRDGATPPLDAKRYEFPDLELDPGNRHHLAGGQYDFSDGVYQERPLMMLPNKVDQTMKMLISYIKRTDWPISAGAAEMSFKKKYYKDDSDDDRVAQIAANIIMYVVAKESPAPVTCAPRFIRTGTVANPTYSLNSNGSTGSYVTLGRNLTITEMGMWMESTPTGPMIGASRLYKCHFRLEAYLPPHYGIEKLNLVPDSSANPGYNVPGWFATFTAVRDDSTTYYYMFPAGTSGPPIAILNNITDTGYSAGVRIFASDIVQGGCSEGGAPGGTWMMPGKPVVIEKIFYRLTRPDQKPELNMQVGLHLGQSDNRGAMLRSINAADAKHNSVGLLLPSAGNASRVVYGINVPDTTNFTVAGAAAKVTIAATPNLMKTMEIDDPRTGMGNGDWFRNPQGNTFGSINSISTLGKSPTQSYDPNRPQQDTDSAGRISDASCYMPPPAGQVMEYDLADGTRYVDDNRLGRVLSVAELGFVCTGTDAKNKAEQTALNPADPQRSIAYRSLRLQPSKYAGTDVLPDWILADLFAAPRVNTNQRVPNTIRVKEPNSVADPCSPLYTPYGTLVGGRVNLNSAATPFALDRVTPLAAVFKGARVSHARSGILPLGSPEADNPTDQSAIQFAKNIQAKRISPKDTGNLGSLGKEYGIPGVLDSTGEICEIRGIADGGEASERLLQDVLDLTTIRGGVFTIYSIGQAIKQTTAGKLIVVGEQRQQSMVERYIDDADTPADKVDDAVRFKTVYYRNLTP